MPLSSSYLALEQKAFSLGLSALGVAASGPARTFDLFVQCVVKGQCADLTYLTDDVELRRSPTSVLPDARSVIVVALSERTLKEESRDATVEIYSSPELQSSKEGAPRRARLRICDMSRLSRPSQKEITRAFSLSKGAVSRRVDSRDGRHGAYTRKKLGLRSGNRFRRSSFARDPSETRIAILSWRTPRFHRF